MKSAGNVVPEEGAPGWRGGPIFTEFCLERGCKNGNWHPETSHKCALDAPAHTSAVGKKGRSTGLHLAKITGVGEAGLKL